MNYSIDNNLERTALRLIYGILSIVYKKLKCKGCVAIITVLEL